MKQQNMPSQVSSPPCFTRRTIQTLFFLLGVVPFVATWPYLPYGTWVAETSAVILALMACGAVFYQTRSRLDFRLSPLAITALVLVALIAFETVILQPPYLTVPLIAGSYLLLVALLAMAVDHCQREDIDVFTPLIRGLFYCSWIQILFVFLQSLGAITVYNHWVAAHSSWWFPHYPESLGTGLLFQKNHLVTFLFISLLAAAYLFHSGRLSKYVWMVWLVLAGIVFFLASSRSLILYAGCIGLLSGGVILKSVAAETRRYARILLMSVTTTLFLAQFIGTPFNFLIKNMGSRYVYQSGLQRLNQASLFADRLRLWQKGLLMFRDHPWIGVGWGGYGAESFHLQTSLPFLGDHRTVEFYTHCHNLFVQFLAETGLLGTITMTVGLVLIVFNFLKGRWTPERVLIISASVVLFLHSQVEYPLWYAYFLLPLAALISMQETQWFRIRFHKVWLNSLVGFVIVVLLAGSLLACNWYGRIVPVSNSLLAAPVTEAEKLKLRELSRTPLMAAMADFFILVRLMDTTDSDLGAKLALTEKLERTRPVVFVLFRRALYLSYAGRIQEALGCIESAYYNDLSSLEQMVHLFNQTKPDVRLTKIRDRLTQYAQDSQAH